MATEVRRKDFGMTSKGAVTLIVFNNSGDEDEPHYTYQVRHGVRTVGDYSSVTKGETVARAIAESI